MRGESWVALVDPESSQTNLGNPQSLVWIGGFFLWVYLEIPKSSSFPLLIRWTRPPKGEHFMSRSLKSHLGLKGQRQGKPSKCLVSMAAPDFAAKAQRSCIGAEGAKGLTWLGRGSFLEFVPSTRYPCWGWLKGKLLGDPQYCGLF